MNNLLGSVADPTPNGSFIGLRNSSVEGANPSASFLGGTSTGPSPNAKSLYKELAMFEL